MDRICAIALLVALVSSSRPALAHSTRSVSVEVVEVSPGSAVLHVRTQFPSDRIDVGVGLPCTSQPFDRTSGAELSSASLRVACPGTVAGATISIAGLGPIVTEAIVLYSFADGRTGSAVVRAEAPVFALPKDTRWIDVARSYVGSGTTHILAGYDHLLFLLLLVLNLRRVRSVLLAETAFTFSHSLSFSATALGWVHVSPPATEACIALSLVLMALDIRAGEPGPALRGAGLALVFGLVHGLGFAGGLSEVGLPDRDVAVALVGFACGVEVGQLLFLAVALVAIEALTRASSSLMHRLEPIAIVAVGGVSTYWLIERLLSMFTIRA